MTALVVAALALAVWIYLAVARGGFWRGRENDDVMHDDVMRDDVMRDDVMRAEAASADPVASATTSAAARWPDIVAVIPARDEAELISTTVASLLAQTYAGSLSVIVVDDHSTDGTTDVARRAARDAGAEDRLTVLAAPPLQPGWTGKLSALAHGVSHVSSRPYAPDWLLFTDADIRYEPDAVTALVSSSLENRLVLSSLMVRLRCESLAERVLIPAFVFFFQMLYPFAWIAQPHRRTAAAAGGCVLVRRSALEDAGGLAAIGSELIDDCALARRLKPIGPIRLSLAAHVHSLRAYPAFDDIRRMVVRSAYAQLRFSPWRLVGVVAAMTVVFVAPVVLALLGDGPTRAMALVAWLLMALLYMPMLVRYAVPRVWGFALPAIAATYLFFTMQSAWLHLRGRGGQWKGRVNGPTVGAP